MLGTSEVAQPKVIEGVRLLPWLELAARESKETVAHLRDCKTCMKERSVESRQMMGCGYEKPSPFAAPWSHTAFKRPADADPDRPYPTVCAGYTTKLPEVVEAARAHFHSERETFSSLVGKRATPHLMTCIELMASEVNAVQAWSMRDKTKEP